LAKQRDDGFMELEERYAGYEVYDRDGEKIGKVDDLLVDEHDVPEYIGVKMGFLGMKSTLIPMDLANVDEERRRIKVSVDKTTAKEGPAFDDDEEITPGYEGQVRSHYGLGDLKGHADRGSYGDYYPDRERSHAERWGDSERHTGMVMGDVDREREKFSEHPPSPEREGVTERGSDLEDEDELRVQRSEEELRAGTREREAGGVNVRKRVKTEREQVRVPKRREEVHAERVPAEGETSEAEIGDDEIRVPIIEEEIVVEKRPVVKEEIRLRKEVIEDEEVVEEDVRKEEVDVDDQTERGVTRERAEDVDETGHSLPEKTRDKTSSEDRSGADTKKESKEDTRTNPPFEGYEELTVKEAEKKIGGLSEDELEKIRSYEKEHKNRKTLIKQLDRKLGDAS
jgi:uncharacterized protein (TIGR02271 family)